MLTLLTLGTLSLQNGNQITTGAGAQRSRLALLAVLAVAGPRGVSRDKLLGYFWADVSEERARHALKQACYALRRSAGADLFVNGGAMLALDPVIASNLLATVLARKANGRVDGFIIEGPTAGGHNAPPRGETVNNDRGEPVYGDRDVVDLEQVRALASRSGSPAVRGTPSGLPRRVRREPPEFRWARSSRFATSPGSLIRSSAPC